MTNEPNVNDPNQPEGAQPFCDLQAELEGLDLSTGATESAPAPDATTPWSAATAAAAPASKGKPRLCPGCNGVHEFAEGRCLNCGYQLGDATPHGAEAIHMVGEAYETRSPMTKVALVLLAVVLLGIAGWFAWPMLSGGGERKSTDASTDIAGAKDRAEDKAAAEEAAALPTVAVKVDDALRTRISTALRAGNDAWQGQGVKAYVYRYAVKDHTDADLQQQLRLVGYVGGADAATAIADPKDEMFYTATQNLMDELNGNAGVTATIDLMVGSQEEFADGDLYVAYGRDYGQDHISDIQPVIDAIANYKNDNGQYPLALDGTVIQGVRTKGNPNFISNGYGYIPVLKTDGSGNVLMGTGAGVAKLNPAEVSGYYLLVFLNDPTQGLDLYSPADLGYYTQKLSPFPYKPQGYVKNMPLTKDGKPDGIGAIVKNGKLL